LKYIYGIVPSRRLGSSLGVSPIPFKTCDYSCVYCQLGNTTHMTLQRQTFFDPDQILREIEEVSRMDLPPYDVVSLVGEGEPTLFQPLDVLVKGIKKMLKKPVVLITNGSLFMQQELCAEIAEVDILMPTLDAWDQQSFRTINRPHGQLLFSEVFAGMRHCLQGFPGEVWLEVMLVKGLNDSDFALEQLQQKVNLLQPRRVYVNVPVRPPAVEGVVAPSPARLGRAQQLLGGTGIEKLAPGSFVSFAGGEREAVKGFIRRHPMSRGEIEQFLGIRGFGGDREAFFRSLSQDPEVEVRCYATRTFFRVKEGK